MNKFNIMENLLFHFNFLNFSVTSIRFTTVNHGRHYLDFLNSMALNSLFSCWIYNISNKKYSLKNTHYAKTALKK